MKVNYRFIILLGGLMLHTVSAHSILLQHIAGDLPANYNVLSPAKKYALHTQQAIQYNNFFAENVGDLTAQQRTNVIRAYTLHRQLAACLKQQLGSNNTLAVTS